MAEAPTAHSESTTLGVRQAKRPRAQVFSEDPILLPEIVDQIVLVTVHPASEREDEDLQRRRHSLRLLGRLDQHRPSLGRFFAPYGEVLRTAGEMKSIEVFYNFMIMDAPFLGECLAHFSPDECRNYFRHCGYSAATRS